MTIITQQRAGEDYKTATIYDDGLEIAEYRLDRGGEKAQVARIRREINRHLDTGGTMGNYQW